MAWQTMATALFGSSNHAAPLNFQGRAKSAIEQDPTSSYYRRPRGLGGSLDYVGQAVAATENATTCRQRTNQSPITSHGVAGVWHSLR